VVTEEFQQPLDESSARHAAGWGQLAGKVALGTVSLLVLVTTGFAWSTYSSLTGGLHGSNALAGETTSTDGSMNILVMGLDSRLDENGTPLPPAEYEALHAGTAADGGMNSNVVILLHVPANPNQKATAISIPRDDYVQFAGCPYGQCGGKIKQAYGLAYAQEHDKLASSGMNNPSQENTLARDAARKEEIDTVRQFLGGVPIDHFIEVTMAAFYEIAQVEAPIQVCVNENTTDSFSGANFHQGINELTASEAVAFVRQRRDPNTSLNFTELDRERRQQAFIASLAYQLRHSGTFADPTKLSALINVAKNNMAVDNGLNLIQFAQQASGLTSGKITFFTMPVQAFTEVNGEDANQVNLPQVRQIASQLLDWTPPPSASGPQSPAKPTIDVDNASGTTGLAGKLESALASQGYSQGQATTATSNQSHSLVEYSGGDAAAASQLATQLGGLATQQSASVPTGHLKVVIGTTFTMPSALQPSGTSNSGTSSSASDTVHALTDSTGSAPSPPALPSTPMGGSSGAQPSSITGGGIPCVK
jgi:LCP family protein required for cell wall assembly